MSRTSKSIQNSKIAIIFYILNLGLNFVSRKVFITHLGADILGLNTTATNLLEFLNLAELGIGSAITFTLYKPIINYDYNQINEIISLQGWLYKRIALFVTTAGVILMFFFPLIFKDISFPFWYTYASFSVLLLSTILSYIVNYKQILLSATQQEYKIIYSYKATMMIRTIFQIVAISYLSNGYLWWLVLQIAFTLLSSYFLDKTVKKEFPYLQTNTHQGSYLQKKYAEILKKIKQLFIHKLAGFALNQSSSIIIYIFTSLTVVAIYGNYMLIISGITLMFQAAFNGISAGVGSLVAEGDKNKMIKVFEELFSSRFLVVVSLAFCIINLSDSFIILWVGEKYLLDKTTLFLMTSIMFINLTRITVDEFINASGLFKDIWAPIAEAILNISLSLILGHYWGINGVLIGVLISLIIIVLLWKPYFLFSYGLKYNIQRYIYIYIKHIICGILSFYLSYILLQNININYSNRVLSWITVSIIHLFTISIILYILLLITSPGMRDFSLRIKRIIINH